MVSKDEIGMLAESFNKMADEVEEYTSHMEEMIRLKTEISNFKTDLISNVSHELRTPITTIYGSIEVLLSEDIDDESTLQLFYNSIFRDIKMLKKIVNNLLMISVVETNECFYSNVSLREFFEYFEERMVRDEMQEIVRSKKVEVLMPIRDKLKASDIAIRTDRSYLTHIFYEVVNNAIIYNNENGRVTIDMTDSPGLEIAVWDNGIGISETHIDKVFDNFFRVDNTATYSVAGIGLGLSVVKMICRKLGYSIAVESKLGEYTKVVLKLK